MASSVAAPALLLSWEQLDEAVAELAARIAGDGTPDVIVGVLRGGIVPAVCLAHALGVRDLRAVSLTHTADDSVHSAKTATPRINDAESLGDLAGRDVLVVDDVAGTGLTAAAAIALATEAGAARVRSAVLVLNQDNWTWPDPPDSTLTYIVTTIRGWVVFPWEAQP